MVRTKNTYRVPWSRPPEQMPPGWMKPPAKYPYKRTPVPTRGERGRLHQQHVDALNGCQHGLWAQESRCIFDPPRCQAEECAGCGTVPCGPQMVWPWGGCKTFSVEEEIDGEITCFCLDGDWLRTHEDPHDQPPPRKKRRRPPIAILNSANRPSTPDDGP